MQLLCVLDPNFWITFSVACLQLGSAFVHHFDIFLLRHNYVIYLFDRITFFDDVRITLYFDMFELRIKITLQSCFAFARHCDLFLLRYNYVIYLFDVVTFLVTLELRYILIRLNYVWK